MAEKQKPSFEQLFWEFYEWIINSGDIEIFNKTTDLAIALDPAVTARMLVDALLQTSQPIYRQAAFAAALKMTTEGFPE